MIVSSSKAKKLARSLLRENRNGRSWRAIANEDYGGRVNFATLNRIAISKGEWLPKDCELLTALGLSKKPRSPFSILPKWFRRTPEALEFFKSRKERIKQMSRDTREAAKR